MSNHLSFQVGSDAPGSCIAMKLFSWSSSRGARRVLPFLLAWGVMTAAPAVAEANGLFPSASQLVFDPKDPQRMALRTTFGVVSSVDGGKTFAWTCERALHYQNILPAIALPAGGPLVLGIATGVVSGELAACDHALAEGFAGEIADVTTARKIPERVLALDVDYITHTTRVWESNDYGQTFAVLGEPFTSFFGATIDVAPSDPNVIYVSGMPSTPNAQGRLLRSDDHGATFTSYEIPDSTGLRWPYIGAVDPERAERIYVRLSDFPGLLKVSDDGGATFTQVLSIPSEVQAFALSPDGKTVLVSSLFAGTFRADTETLAFEQISCAGVNCLTWNSAGLFACGDQTLNSFLIARSEDEGRTYERMLDVTCLDPIIDCAADTTRGLYCPADWPMIKGQLSILGECNPDAGPPPVLSECFGTGGASNSGGASARGGRGAMSSGGRSTAGSAGDRSDERDSGGCHFQRRSTRNAWNASLLITLASLSMLISRRRRGPRAASARRPRPL